MVVMDSSIDVGPLSRSGSGGPAGCDGASSTVGTASSTGVSEGNYMTGNYMTGPCATEPSPAVVHALLDRAEARFGNRAAVRDGSGRWSYTELNRRSYAIARGLAVLGVRPGDRVLCVLRGSGDFSALLFGALRHGAILVPTVDSSSEYQLRWVIADSRPTLVVTSDQLVDAIQTIASIPVVAVSALIAGASRLGAAMDKSELTVSPASPAFIIYTSGSTARPKGIVCPHATVVWVANAIMSMLKYQSSDVVYNRLPVSFDYGLYQVLLCALAGAEIAFPDAGVSAQELHAIRLSGATVLPLVPTLAALLSRLAARDNRPTSVRLMTSTGEALTTSDAARLRSAFPNAGLVCMYGMSECKRISIALPDEDMTYPGTVGRALPGTRVFVVDGDGCRLPPHELGQIVSAGPHVMRGYWECPADERERFVPAPDGYGRALLTGDFGYLDERGRIYLAGRRDEIFKHHGWRTSSQEIESAAMDVLGVEQAACLPPDTNGQVILWVVTARRAEDILREVGDRIGFAKTPDRCIIVESLPMTSHGKVDRSILRRRQGGSR